MMLKIVFFLAVSFVDVKSECDTYIECLGSFFDNFFSSDVHINATQISDVVVPGFDNVNIEKDNLRSLLSGVSSFIEEELNGDISFGVPINIIRNVGNNTSIYVKTITINEGYDNTHDKDITNTDYIATSETKSINSSVSSIEEIKPILALNITKELKINKNSTKGDKVRKKLHDNEIPDSDDFEMYYDLDDNSTDYPIIDYIDLYKDTTNEYIDIKTTEAPKNFNEMKYEIETEITTIAGNNDNSSIYINDVSTKTSRNVSKTVFPWVAAIFIKNETSNQFDYYCDGALLSETVIITAARCIQYYGTRTKSQDLLVLLGKTSLHSTNEYEKIVKIKDIILHDNFTMGPENDIAILITEQSVIFSEGIQPARLGTVDYEESITTGWALTGELTLIMFDAEKSMNCDKREGNNTFCAVYGNDITVCPSYGGIHAARHLDLWYLNGIRHADPTDRGLCVDKTIIFSDLSYYIDWIREFIE